MTSRANASRLCDDGAVAEPQHELTAARVDELLHLLAHLLGGADEVVAHVLVVRRAAPQRSAARRVEPLLHVGFGVEHDAVGAVRAHDRVEVAADLAAVLLEQTRLAPEALDAGLPVGLVGVLGLDAQRDLLAAAADPDLGQLLDRLRVAVRAVEREVLALERDGLLGPEPLDDLERLVEDLRAACPRSGTGCRTPGTRVRTNRRRSRGSTGRRRTRRRTRLPSRAGRRCGTPRT